MQGFGSRVIAHDLYENEELKALGVEYMPKEALLRQADIISLHCPLLPSTYHIIDRARLGDRPQRCHALACAKKHS